ncbi:MAG: hypothetical protein AWU57_617 [Marinobacter sp. T13-3]|nr:MAG: hypothetical protein AWU57_617 [Marinobacter sp. T13-3]
MSTATANTVTPFVSFDDFVTRRYLKLSDQMQALYGSYTNYVNYNYLPGRGFSEWMDAITGAHLEPWQMHSVARTFFHWGNRTVPEVLDALVYLARQHHIEYPLIEGCLTVDYWHAVAQQEAWYELYRQPVAA